MVSVIRLFRRPAIALCALACIFAASASANAAIRDRGRYDEWDGDHDGFLRQPEFSNHIFNLADKDTDGKIGQKEWDAYTAAWYDPDMSAGQDFSYYDTDENGYLDNGEFITSLTDAGLFRAWDFDRNGYIDMSEWKTGSEIRKNPTGGARS